MKKIPFLFNALFCLTAVGTSFAPGATLSLVVDPSSFTTAAVATAATPIPDGFAGDSFYDTTLAAADSLPASGAFPTLTKTGVSGNVYGFAPNSGDDSIEGSGTLTLATPTAGLSTLYILGTASNGGTDSDVTLTFTDGTTVKTSVFFSDWGNNDGDINGLGRVSQSTPPHQDAGLQFALYDPSISIPTDDQSLTLKSISFAPPSSGAQPDVIFAVDGTLATTPEPSAIALLGFGVAALAITLRARRLSQE